MVRKTDRDRLSGALNRKSCANATAIGPTAVCEDELGDLSVWLHVAIAARRMTVQTRYRIGPVDSTWLPPRGDW